MINLKWDVWQWPRLRDVEQQAQRESAHQDADPHESIKALQQSVQRLSLASAAMWSLVKQRIELTDQDLIARVAQGPLGEIHAGT